MDNDEMILEAIEKMVSFHEGQVRRFKRMIEAYYIEIEPAEPAYEDINLRDYGLSPSEVSDLYEENSVSDDNSDGEQKDDRSEIKEEDPEIKPPVSAIISAKTETDEKKAARIQAIRDGIARKKAAGGYTGRKPGTKNKPKVEKEEKPEKRELTPEQKSFVKSVLPSKLYKEVTGEQPAKIVRPPAEYSNKRPYEFANSLV